MATDDDLTPRRGAPPFGRGRGFPSAFPPGPPARLAFLERDEEEESRGRDAEDIMLRKVPTATAMRFRAAAGARGMTHAQYLSALVSLHESIRGLADAGEAGAAAELERLGLATVSV